MNGNSASTPGYVIYENGNPECVILSNYVIESTGAADYTEYISVKGDTTGQPNASLASAQIKYLLAPSTIKKFNTTWAGQVGPICMTQFLPLLNVTSSGFQWSICKWWAPAGRRANLHVPVRPDQQRLRCTSSCSGSCACLLKLRCVY